MQSEAHGKHGYRKLLYMAAASFVAMYVLMYMMVDRTANVYPNLNQAYMAALMTAPMVLIELLVMRSMFTDRRANIAIIAGALAVLVGCVVLIRAQAGVRDQEFLRSMIPHHAGAILMCERSSLEDPEIRKLCEGIVSSQQSEIDWMRRKLDRL